RGAPDRQSVESEVPAPHRLTHFDAKNSIVGFEIGYGGFGIQLNDIVSDLRCGKIVDNGFSNVRLEVVRELSGTGEVHIRIALLIPGGDEWNKGDQTGKYHCLVLLFPDIRRGQYVQRADLCRRCDRSERLGGLAER